MNSDPQREPVPTPVMPDFAEPAVRESLELRPAPQNQYPQNQQVRRVNRSQKSPKLDLTPVQPPAPTPKELSLENPEDATAEELAPETSSLTEVVDAARVFLDAVARLPRVTDEELRSPRIQVGLGFVSFGALILGGLWWQGTTVHPDWNWASWLRGYWYPSVGGLGLVVTGILLLAREAMRPNPPEEEEEFEEFEDD